MFDRFEDLKDAMDRTLLAQADPPSHAHARQLLELKGVKVARIVATRPEAILYVNEAGAAMTAWMHRKPLSTDMVCEPGFPALED